MLMCHRAELGDVAEICALKCLYYYTTNVYTLNIRRLVKCNI